MFMKVVVNYGGRAARRKTLGTPVIPNPAPATPQALPAGLDKRRGRSVVTQHREIVLQLSDNFRWGASGGAAIEG